MMIRTLVAIGLVAAALALPPATAAKAQQANVADVIYSEIERKVIRDFFGVKPRHTYTSKKADKRAKKRGLPPGLAKRDSLPPGLQKQLERNGRLPPGLEKRDLPPELRWKLKHRAGADHFIVDNDVLLIQRATGLILDIVKDVVTR
jgi:Ni/Co efflux regulator RcnB